MVKKALAILMSYFMLVACSFSSKIDPEDVTPCLDIGKTAVVPSQFPPNYKIKKFNPHREKKKAEVGSAVSGGAGSALAEIGICFPPLLIAAIPLLVTSESLDAQSKKEPQRPVEYKYLDLLDDPFKRDLPVKFTVASFDFMQQYLAEVELIDKKEYKNGSFYGSLKDQGYRVVIIPKISEVKAQIVFSHSEINDDSLENEAEGEGVNPILVMKLKLGAHVYSLAEPEESDYFTSKFVEPRVVKKKWSLSKDGGNLDKQIPEIAVIAAEELTQRLLAELMKL